MNNPFNITFGKIPKNTMISRDDELEAIYNSFNSEEPNSQIYIISGVRGSGKTVAMTCVRDYYKANIDWLCIDLNPEMDMLKQLASKLFDEAKLTKTLINKEFPFLYNGIGFSLTNNEHITNVSTFLSKEFEHLKKKNKKVLITIDETVSNKYMKVFLREFQRLLKENYNVYLVMTGLYQNISTLENEKNLTFFNRASKIYIGELNLKAISNSYKNVFKISEKESDELAEYTKGYAYAYQLLGNILFENKKTTVDDDIIDELDEILYQRAYNIIYNELTPKEKEILKAATNKELNSEIIESINISKSQLSTYKKKLNLKGIIKKEKDKIIFQLPRFKEFIRIIIELED